MEKSLAEIKALILFYEDRGWDWTIAATFLLTKLLATKRAGAITASRAAAGSRKVMMGSARRSHMRAK